MKTFKRILTLAAVSLILTGCGGGGSSSSDSDSPLPDDDTHSAMFSNPAYLASWDDADGEIGVFTRASTCASCHSGSDTVMNSNGEDVSPFTQWKHSTMANSLNDPFFNAFVEEETHVFPHLKNFIEDTCMSCHAPMAYTHAHQTGEGLVKDDTSFILENGGYPFESAIGDHHAREGIACTACHQIQPDNLGTVAGMSGHYKINSDTENAGDAPVFGPFKDLTAQNMLNQTQYLPQYAAHISESAMCATCHNLYTPTLDLDGQPVLIDANDPNSIAQFPEQTPFWEWQNSIYADVNNVEGNKTCQACHMAEPEDNYQSIISTKGPGLLPRPDIGGVDDIDSVFSAHEFVGGNSYLLTLLKTYMTELGLGTDSGHSQQGFQSKIEQTRQFLASSATIETGTIALANDTLEVPVTITNHAGHKLPTSYPSRRMWIHMKVTDNTGAPVFESGAVDSNGRILLDSNFTSYTCLDIEKSDSFDSVAEGCYEPHRDVINSENQVAIYEGVLGDVNQDITHVLLHARQYLKDNRIPPKGWILANQHVNPADANIMDDGIVGILGNDTNLTIESDDPNFAPGKDGAGSDGTDTVTYQIDTTGFTGPFNIEVDLYYQTIRPSFVYAMHADDDEHVVEGNSYVARFKAMYEETPPVTETLASTSTVH